MKPPPKKRPFLAKVRPGPRAASTLAEVTRPARGVPGTAGGAAASWEGGRKGCDAGRTRRLPAPNRPARRREPGAPHPARARAALTAVGEELGADMRSHSARPGPSRAVRPAV